MSESQRDPELDRLLAPLRDGPVALPGAEQEALQRERVVPALRSEVRRLPDRRRMRRIVHGSLSALAGVVAIGTVLFVAPRVQHTTTLHESPRDAAATQLVWVDDMGERAEDVPGTRGSVARDEVRALPSAGASGGSAPRASAMADESALPAIVRTASDREAPRAVVTPNAHEPRDKATRPTRAKRSHRHALPGVSDAEKRLLADALRAERSTQRKRARILFSRLLRSYPRSALAPEARAGLARVR